MNDVLFNRFILAGPPPARPSVRSSYLLAVLLVVLFTVVRLPFQPWLRDVPFLLYFPAIFLSGWYGGLGPGLLTSFLSALVVQFLFMEPELSLSLGSPLSLVKLSIFFAIGALVSWLNEALHRARQSAEAAEEAQAAAAAEQARLYQEAQAALDLAETANRSRDEFLATVSHELRTPLNAMMGWAQLLQLASADDPDRRQHGLDVIVRNGRLQAQLIDDLLDVSRIVSGKMRLNIRPLQLLPIVEAAVESVRPAAEARQIRLQCLLDPEAGRVAGDADRLQQMVWNLLSNAVKFTPKGGRVEVRLKRAASHVEIVVADTGIGIRPDFLPHVFDRFRQQDSSTTRQQGGLGLGLALVRHLTELHGGTVSVQSPGEGLGSTFVLSLPLSDPSLSNPPR